VIVFLQFAHADVVHPGDRSERFAAGDDVAVTITRFGGWFGRRGSGRRCCRRRCRRGAFANHDARTLVGQLCLELEDLLRQHVDLRVLLVDLFQQLLKLRILTRGGLSRSALRRRCEGLRKAARARESEQNGCSKGVRGRRFH